ncbi:hypothetical protein G6F65_022646 [Rhizopus arrhizus]|nr:hypothetical protein G6F65_022646 [Rhizopus arrhizus]
MGTFFGDGAVHQGATHEAMNLAALYGLPMIFFLENNKYAVSMSVEQSTFQTELLTRPQAHGIAAVKGGRHSSWPRSTATTIRARRFPAAPSATARATRKTPGRRAIPGCSCSVN